MRLPRIDHIDYLIERKFPNFRQYKKLLAEDPESDEDSDGLVHIRETMGAATEYRKKLLLLPESEFLILHSDELEKQRIKDDKNRFFNKPHAKADFEYWAKMDGWSLEEAVALSFGRDPKIVSWNKIGHIPSNISPFVHEYEKIRELATRAKLWSKLYDPIMPCLYVNWAVLMEIPFPDELVKLVKSRMAGVVDWRQMYEELLKKYKADLVNSREAPPEHKYIPPYVSYMLQASENLNLSPKSRINKESIVNWLRENWPSELEGKSERLVQSMATILRRPEDKKGGNTPWSSKQNIEE